MKHQTARDSFANVFQAHYYKAGKIVPRGKINGDFISAQRWSARSNYLWVIYQVEGYRQATLMESVTLDRYVMYIKIDKRQSLTRTHVSGSRIFIKSLNLKHRHVLED